MKWQPTTIFALEEAGCTVDIATGEVWKDADGICTIVADLNQFEDAIQPVAESAPPVQPNDFIFCPAYIAVWHDGSVDVNVTNRTVFDALPSALATAFETHLGKRLPIATDIEFTWWLPKRGAS
jgi:hypothetical protein